jgi:uncharacterized repeat protein (TIGR03943 family)
LLPRVGRLPGFALVLSLAGIVATIWLGATDQLALYVHPRYVGFTVTMAVLAAIVLIFGTLFIGFNTDDKKLTRSQHVIRALWRIFLVTALGASLLVIPPATLSVNTAQTRDTGLQAYVDSGSNPSFSSLDRSSYSVRDWAIYLASTPAESAIGEKVSATGFLLATQSPDIAVVSRFVVTCCTVDAQPIGIPVYLPEWQTRLKAGDWLAIQGELTAGPANSGLDVVVTPANFSVVPEPAKPYVY